tara:strand:+ start:3032 stop:4336 length:1305 start_codon:yes stop_codon:yes gene_type:complete
MSKKERGLWELYANDPEKADAEIWGRQTEKLSRRGFLKKSGLAALSAAIGFQIPFFRSMPSGLIPVTLAEASEETLISEKNGLRVLNERPINAETPPHLLDDDFTPNDKHFVRNNGLTPHHTDRPGEWELTVDGEVHQPLKLTLDELKKNFKHRTLALQLECGGNGRAGYNPRAKGNQWTFGAIGCARYTGVRLSEVLRAAILKSSAVYTGYYGKDLHLSGDPKKVSISRGTPILKAMDEHTLLVWEMNGEPLPLLHGFPLRLISPGWPGSASPKWLSRIVVRDRIHDGHKMNKYRIPRYPVAPGTHVPLDDMVIIESLPVKSLITNPQSGVKISKNYSLELRGKAWAGSRKVEAVHVSFDFGSTWLETDLMEASNRYAWQRWTSQVNFPKKGYYEVWVRASDNEGVMQPMVVPGWNPSGYINNAMHRIAVTVV